MVKEQLNEYNGIKVGDTVKIVVAYGECFGRYELWLDTFSFDKTKWKADFADPRRGDPCKVLGIAKHLNFDDGDPEHEDVLFYVDDGQRTWIMGSRGIQLVTPRNPQSEKKNYCIIEKGKKIFYLID